MAHREFVDGIVQEVFSELSYSEVSKRLTAADVAFAPLNGCSTYRPCDFHTENIQVQGQNFELPRVPGLPRAANFRPRSQS